MADAVDLKSIDLCRKGSNPFRGTKCGVSSMVEQGTHNSLVVGSSPAPRTKIFLNRVYRDSKQKSAMVNRFSFQEVTEK